MPSLTDLSIEELKTDGAALEVIKTHLGELKDNKAKGNCGYYAIGIGLQQLKIDVHGKKIPGYAFARNKACAKQLREALLDYGQTNAHYFMCHKELTSPNINVLWDSGHTALLNSRNYETHEHRQRIFMGIVGNSILSDDFDDSKDEGIDQEFYLKAYETFPLIASKFKVNITLYDLDKILTSYCYYHDGRVYVWRVEGLYKPVENSAVLTLKSFHFQTLIQDVELRRKMEVTPKIEPGEYLDPERCRKEVGPVYLVELSSDEEVVKDSVDSSSDISVEKIPKKKNRKYDEKKEKTEKNKNETKTKTDGRKIKKTTNTENKNKKKTKTQKKNMKRKKMKTKGTKKI